MIGLLRFQTTVLQGREVVLRTFSVMFLFILICACPTFADSSGDIRWDSVDEKGNHITAVIHAPDSQVEENENGDDPDLPFFLHHVNKAKYLQLRNEQILMLRGLPYKLPYDARQKALLKLERQEAARKMDGPSMINALSWTSIGPAPIPNGQTKTLVQPVSGRVTCIAVHPTNPDIVYAGTAQGGVYRTLNGGTTWTPIFDSAQSLAIGAITIDPLDPTIVFVGTGESSFATGAFGVGLYRINNADTSPVLNGPFETRVAGTGTAVESVHAFAGTSITAIVVDPADDNRIFVGNTYGYSGISNNATCCGGNNPPTAFLGLYFSSNAKSGSPTFSRVSGIPGDGFSAVTDIVFEPGSSSKMLVGVMDLNSNSSNHGIYRTTDANTASISPSTSPTFGKVTATAQSRIKLAMNKVGSTVIAVAAIGLNGGTVYRSPDGGVSFTQYLSTANGFCGAQCSFDIAVAIDQSNASRIYLGGQAAGLLSSHQFMKSINGGISFAASDTGLHADTHAIAIAPSLTSRIYLGEDGGIFVSNDYGDTWTSLNNTGFNATQFVSVATHGTDDAFLIGGTQDNGTQCLGICNGTAAGTWFRTDGGDGGFAAVDKGSATLWNTTLYHTYVNLKNLGIAFATVNDPDYASTGEWVALGCGSGVSPNGISCSDDVLPYPPLVLGPGTPNTLYFGTNRVYRSTDKGLTMSVVSQAPLAAVVSAIGISPQDDNFRCIGLANGTVLGTFTGSSTLTTITGAITPGVFGTYVSRCVFDPADKNTAYVTLNGYGMASHVWKTTNFNSVAPTWTAAGSGIPDVPVNAFAINPYYSTKLYAGTDIGVYSSTNSGTSWVADSVGLPRVAVFDMAFQGNTGTLRIATFGRGIWEAITCAPAGAPTINNITDIAFCTNKIGINFTAGAGATLHELWKDGALADPNFTTIGNTYVPHDQATHSYQVRARKEGCSTGSNIVNFADTTGMGAPTNLQFHDEDGCAQNGINLTFTPGSGAQETSLYMDDLLVQTGYTSGETFNPGDNVEHYYNLTSNRMSCPDVPSGSVLGTDQNVVLGAPTGVTFHDANACSAGINVTFTGGANTTSHSLLKDGSMVVANYSSGSNYNPGDTASHNYAIRGNNGACTLDSTNSSGADTVTNLSLNPGNPPAARQNQLYAGFVFQTSGAVGGVIFTSDQVPAGMSLSTNGTLSGTPAAQGDFTMNITATDSNNCSVSAQYVLHINPACLFCDDFEDDILAGNWSYLAPSWNEQSGSLVGSPATKAIAIAAPVFSTGCKVCTIQATMQTAGGAGNSLWLLGWYKDKKNTMELLMKQETSQFVLQQRVNGAVLVKKTGSPKTLFSGVDYDVKLMFDGTKFTVTVDGIPTITLKPSGKVPKGTIGFMVKDTIGTFSEVNVN